MKPRMLRALVKILRGRGLKTLAAPKPGAAQWHIATSEQAGFKLRDLPEKRPWFTKHYFDVTSPTGIRGHVSATQRPARTHIVGVFSESEDQPLDLGFKGYRRLFRDLRSAVGLPKETPITFHRIPNVLRGRPGKVRWRKARESIILR